ncbi:MAG: hypothetical protein QM718_13115 [Steroidobacteraceae bacterium]
MRPIILSCAMLLAGALTVARAEHLKPQLIEDAVETQADLISLPDAAGGVLTVRACSTCAIRTFRLSGNFATVIRGQSVPLATYASRLRALGPVSATVIYTISDQLVTRITVEGL